MPVWRIVHNKMLAAQLPHEFRNFFENVVEYFVSDYDDDGSQRRTSWRLILDIECDPSQNDLIARLWLLGTSSLLTRRDVVVVVSAAGAPTGSVCRRSGVNVC